MQNFLQSGKVSSIIGMQYGSCAKGSAAAWLAVQHNKEGEFFNIVAVNNGSQSGHSSIHDGVKRVAFHLPTYPLIANVYGYKPIIYLTAGAVIDVAVLMKEIADFKVDPGFLFIHPNAAVITDECKEAEMAMDSAQTKIASTRKGVGEAIARKVLRSGLVAKNCPELTDFIRRRDLNSELARGASILMEVPQGFSLSLNGKFYPHCTSRACTVQQALSDADIHPSFCGPTMGVARTYPIRVGSLHKTTKDGDMGEELSSGGHYHDQREISWDDLGQTAEITTVTKRVRRVFTWSQTQVLDAMAVIRPEVVMLTFTNYLKTDVELKRIVSSICAAASTLKMTIPKILLEFGPTTLDVREATMEDGVWDGDDVLMRSTR